MVADSIVVWYDLIHHSIAIPTVVLFASNSNSLSLATTEMPVEV
jgi:hypothetical protein